MRGKSTTPAGSYFKQMTLPLNTALAAIKPARHLPIHPGEGRVAVRPSPPQGGPGTGAQATGIQAGQPRSEKPGGPEIRGNPVSSMDTPAQSESRRLIGPSSPAFVSGAASQRPDAHPVVEDEPVYYTGERPRSHGIELPQPQFGVEAEERNWRSGSPNPVKPIEDSAIGREETRQSELPVRSAPASPEITSTTERDSITDGDHNRGRSSDVEPSLLERSLIRTPEGQSGDSTVHIGTIEVRVISKEALGPPVVPQLVDQRGQATSAGQSRGSAPGSLARGLQSPFGLRQG